MTGGRPAKERAGQYHYGSIPDIRREAEEEAGQTARRLGHKAARAPRDPGGSLYCFALACTAPHSWEERKACMSVGLDSQGGGVHLWSRGRWSWQLAEETGCRDSTGHDDNGESSMRWAQEIHIVSKAKLQLKQSQPRRRPALQGVR